MTTQTNQAFSAAIAAATQDGKVIWRAAWEGTGLWVDRRVIDEKDGLALREPGKGSDRFTLWTPNSGDMLAADWSIADEAP